MNKLEISSIIIGIVLLCSATLAVLPISFALSQSPSLTVDYPQQLCSLPNNHPVGGLTYSRTPDIRSKTAGVWIVDRKTGSLYWCDVGKATATLVTTSPDPGSGYYGIANWDSWNTGNSTGQGDTVVVTSYSLHGMYFCYHATVNKCGEGTSSFIEFPSSYCSSLKTETCNPYGTAIDASLNVYWVDPNNKVFSECTASSNYTSCFTLGASSYLKGQPTGLAFINGTAPYFSRGWQFLISDSSCAGYVWDGNTTSLRLVAKVNNSLQGISTTILDVGYTQQIVVGDTGQCNSSVAKLLDLSNSTQTFPTTFKGPTRSIGIANCIAACIHWGESTKKNYPSYRLFYDSGSSAYYTSGS